MYCLSKARSAASTVDPIPTIPSSTLGPSSAIQSPLRIDNAGRRTADGLLGCAAQYDPISTTAVRAGSASLKAFLEIRLVLLLILEKTTPSGNNASADNASAGKIAQSGTQLIYV